MVHIGKENSADSNKPGKSAVQAHNTENRRRKPSSFSTIFLEYSIDHSMDVQYISMKYTGNQGCMSLSTYSLEYDPTPYYHLMNNNGQGRISMLSVSHFGDVICLLEWVDKVVLSPLENRTTSFTSH